MRYGKFYGFAKVNSNLLQDTLSKVNPENMLLASVETGGDKKARNANVNWIKDEDICKRWLTVTKSVNKDLGWDFNLDAMEFLQYGEYNKDQYYGWHVDQHKKPYPDGRVRKISFSVFLNDDYEGGEFDLEIGSPRQGEDRVKTFKNNKLNSILFFQSDYWHQVRPVTKGVRKSLVGWVLGPKFK
jgi:PKHD-type hydroxylase